MPELMSDIELEIPASETSEMMKKNPGNCLTRFVIGLGKIFWITFAVSVCAFSIGIVIGVFGVGETDDKIEETIEYNYLEIFDNYMSGDAISEHLKILTKDPHTGGTDEDEIVLVNYIKKEMETSFLQVKISEYDVLLSYPNREEGERNWVGVCRLNHSDGCELVPGTKSAEVEEILDESQDNPLVFNPFIAYSTATGDEDFYGEPVYVNYGTKEDFMFLIENNIIDPENTEGTKIICLARYGRIFRGNKARYAEEYGCSGLIIFSDSMDYAKEWIEPYPESWFLPKTGAQRGTTYLENGDPETPFYPSIPGAYRWTRAMSDLYGDKFNLPGLPNIPITPIGYGDAAKILSRMSGEDVIEAWQGGIKDENGNLITYKYKQMNDSEKVQMFTGTFEEVKTTKNVIGYYEGIEEPDRYIIFGNHRDAWVFGAMDPNSGTTILIEVFKAFGELYNQGWRPKRTLMFISWGSEEYGLIGSQEWVEEKLTILTARSILYVNCDVGVSGNYTFSPAGTPNMKELMFDVAKMVENPRIAEDGPEAKTIYDNMVLRQPAPLQFPAVGSGSDYAPFLQQVGTSIINIGWSPPPDVGGYPVYHSVYETFELVSRFVDPGFVIHRQTALMCALVLEKLSDAPILPMNAVDYAIKIQEEIENLMNVHAEAMISEGITFEYINNYAVRLVNAAKSLHEALDSTPDDDLPKLRALNDKLMMLERSFIDPNGLPDRLQYRHVIFAPSSQNSYASAVFPAVYDALFDIENSEDSKKSWENVKEQFATLSFFIYNAANVLSLDII